MNGMEAMKTMLDGKTVRIPTGCAYRIKHGEFQIRGAGSDRWERGESVCINRFLNDDWFSIVEEYPLTFTEALHAMVDGRMCECGKRPGVRYVFNTMGRFRYFPSNVAASFSEMEHAARWRIVDIEEAENSVEGNRGGRHEGFKTIDELCSWMEERMEELDRMDPEEAYNAAVKTFRDILVATLDTLDRQPQGGITGFMHEWIVKMFMVKELYPDSRCGVRVLDLDDMLYPQNREMFMTVDSETWATLQGMALEKSRMHPGAHPDVMAHWQSIVDGKVPFGMVVRE